MLQYIQHRDEQHLHQVIESGQRLVRHFAKLYGPGGITEDLIQCGLEGLLKAAYRYDPQRGTAFCTYASHCIIGEIRHYLRKEAAYCRPIWAVKMQEKINETIERTIRETGETLSIERIAEKLNIQVEGIMEAQRAGWVPLDELDIRKVRHREYRSFELPIEDKIALQQVLATLSDLQRKVIDMLFYRSLTQTETAELLGISQRKVSRILQRSLDLLAKRMTSE
ncbi:sigma-70 family RNA polymerase sigma factor [Heliobacillus mobilis]|uniref:Sigma-70 family RNA polymerase sigma factor n=2 Tax=Heliobacterium mobile TaxID=28064 RepID=A0A6I3SKB7_HELMO|nr:sigma-70 family RNA polymerase sigma factor [Heliobacterium mobile]